MAKYRVPVFLDVSFYTYTAQLEGRTYRFVFSFNERSQSWYMDIADDNDLAIVQGQRLSNDFPLARSRDSRRPPGMFVCISLEDDNSDPALADLGRRVKLLYFDEADIPEPVATTLDLTVVPTP